MSNRPIPKCEIVKNPCKYCLAQVTNKNGLQCQGACKRWAHFKCLNYTPGRIADIKAGIIKVLCPCTDCETNQEKEYLTNPPYTCLNEKCPSNATGPVKCESEECPLNKDKLGQEQKCSTKLCTDDALNNPTQMTYLPPRKPYPSQLLTPQSSPIPKRSRPLPCPSCGGMPKVRRPGEMTSPNSLPSLEDSAHLNEDARESSRESQEEQYLILDALHEMSGTVGVLSKQIKQLVRRIRKTIDNEANQSKLSDKTE